MYRECVATVKEFTQNQETGGVDLVKDHSTTRSRKMVTEKASSVHLSPNNIPDSVT